MINSPILCSYLIDIMKNIISPSSQSLFSPIPIGYFDISRLVIWEIWKVEGGEGKGTLEGLPS